MRLPQSNSRRIVGTDASFAMLNAARSKCIGVEFVHADLNVPLPFADHVFQTVVCVNALYALAEPAKTLKEFSRIICPHGLLIVVTPKLGYENGLILKSHCRSEKDDAYWIHMHASPERERQLVREAMNDEILAERFLQVAKINRAIVRERSFHFFTKGQLSRLVSESGFTDIRIERTYAKQNLLLTAKRTRKESSECR